MTEAISPVPGWGDERLDELFATLPDTPQIKAACDAYVACVASRKAPAAPSDMLGAEFNGCRTTLCNAIRAQSLEGVDELDAKLEAFEAELTAES